VSTRRGRTGYEGPTSPRDEDLPPPATRRWRLVRPADHFTTRVVGQLTLDGEPIGLVYLPDDEHFSWLEKQLQKREHSDG